MMRLVCRAAVPGGLPLLLAAPAWALTPSEPLKGSIDRLIPILEDQAKLQERRAASRVVADEVSDFDESATLTPGSPRERRSFAARPEQIKSTGEPWTETSPSSGPRTAPRVPVDSHVIGRGERGLVSDVVMATDRAPFNTLIQTSSVEDLVRGLKAKQPNL